MKRRNLRQRLGRDQPDFSRVFVLYAYQPDFEFLFTLFSDFEPPYSLLIDRQAIIQCTLW